VPARPKALAALVCACAAVAAAGIAFVGLRGHLAGAQGVQPPLASHAAYRATTDTLITATAWSTIPDAVAAAAQAGQAAPSIQVVRADGGSWLVMTTGSQPRAQHLLPLSVTVDPRGAAVVSVALAADPAAVPGTDALALALPQSVSSAAVQLHLITSPRGVWLGAVPAGMCPPASSPVAAAQACAQPLGLGQAAWKAAAAGATATQSGQRFRVAIATSAGRAAPQRVDWLGPA
jgi:hypothetical protein